MDDIKYAEHIVKINKFYHCEICNDYKVDRMDNMKRHIREKHYKYTVTCKCGSKVKRSVLARHKNSHCRLRNVDDGMNSFLTRKS